KDYHRPGKSARSRLRITGHDCQENEGCGPVEQDHVTEATAHIAIPLSLREPAIKVSLTRRSPYLLRNRNGCSSGSLLSSRLIQFLHGLAWHGFGLFAGPYGSGATVVYGILMTLLWLYERWQSMTGAEMSRYDVARLLL